MQVLESISDSLCLRGAFYKFKVSENFKETSNLIIVCEYCHSCEG